MYVYVSMIFRIHTYMHAYRQTDIHSYMHSYIPTYIHIYIYIYPMHLYYVQYIDCIHIYIYVIVNTKPSNGKLYRCRLPSPQCDDLANRKVRIPISLSLFGCLEIPPVGIQWDI